MLVVYSWSIGNMLVVYSWSILHSYQSRPIPVLFLANQNGAEGMYSVVFF